MKRTDKNQRGFALVGTLLLILLISALAATMFYAVSTENKVGANDLSKNLAQYAAESGMEKMNADLVALYFQKQAPSVADIKNLEGFPPVLPGVTYLSPADPINGYTFKVPNVVTPGTPDSSVRTVSSGPNEGLVATISQMTLKVTAQVTSGAQVKLTRTVDVALIPVFQFGVFSDTDLSFFPGPNFDFGGRTHTNGNLFLASTNTLTMGAKVTALGEVIRTNLSNGGVITAGSGDPRLGNVNILTAPNGCAGAAPACRNLSQTEGSLTGGLGSPANPNWTNISLTTYGGFLRNGKTGVQPLRLPFVAPGVADSIELLRQPRQGEDTSSFLYLSRLYGQANIRVLLADTPAELPGGAADPDNIQLTNVGWAATGVPTINTYFAEGISGHAGEPTDWITRTAPIPSIPVPAPGSWPANSWPLIDGFLRVEVKKLDGTYLPVTKEWLQLGFARGLAIPNSEAGVANAAHPNAILILQQLADRNADGALISTGESATVTGAGARNNFYPINMYDTREGEVRDTNSTDDPTKAAGADTCALGGIMNLVELDVNNLRRWVTGAIGANGSLTDPTKVNGYLLYFSDHRGMLNDPNVVPPQKIGEYGFEDILNASNAVSGAPDAIQDVGEDVNQNGIPDNYGAQFLGTGFNAPNNDPTARGSCEQARKNQVTGPRHALRLVNGTLGNLPKNGANGGFSVGSDNPVYVYANYNANNAGFGNPDAAAAVMADAVTLLSNAWSDQSSFTNPLNPGVRAGAATWYRVAIAGGKNLSFPLANFPGASADFGTDGGVHNFLRYLEAWPQLNYMGSLVSLYYSQYGTGVYKCCRTVYSPPNRNYSFDTNFLTPALLPPGTPLFRDVNNIGSLQDFSAQ